MPSGTDHDIFDNLAAAVSGLALLARGRIDFLDGMFGENEVRVNGNLIHERVKTNDERCPGQRRIA